MTSPSVGKPLLRWLIAAAVIVTLATSETTLAKSKWVEVRTPNFVVVSNAGEKRARKVGLQLERFKAAHDSVLNPVGKTLTATLVFAVKNTHGMKKLLPKSVGKRSAVRQ